MASRAEAELGATLSIVKKTSPQYSAGIDPPCPSVVVNGRIVVRDGAVDYDLLRAEMLKEGA